MLVLIGRASTPKDESMLGIALKHEAQDKEPIAFFAAQERRINYLFLSQAAHFKLEEVPVSKQTHFLRVLRILID